ncbi:MAG: response regulator transcription factor [Bacteroidota bacterium]|nr:response regulator transcription factor [Bacteroidota bacterium]MDP4216515.1 response regulator transcription factor [Bacteroidota bacterium]MDP4247061.1 response regulator transcription factor [Bacteroidota bacterium]MDP4254034.1 response regulator transcription factor [Bacteroidota bacterium]MDP4257436.1 response regulator transcription factor [Bacteroidota bacterium]
MRILIADDHALIREGLKHILLEEFPAAFIAEAPDAESVLKMMISGDWDVIICDLSMPGRSGLDVVLHVKQNFPKIPVLILSIHPEEQYAIRAIKTGAAGYLSKDAAAEELVKAVRRVLLGRKYVSPQIADKLADELDQDRVSREPHEVLSQREFDVFLLLSAGYSVSEISGRLVLSTTTVSTYRGRIMGKMKMRSNADLTRYALDYKLI